MKKPFILNSLNNLLIPATALVTVDSEHSKYPIANIKSLPVAKPFRANGKILINIDIDFGSIKTVDTIAVIGHNFSPTVTLDWMTGAGSIMAKIPYSRHVCWLHHSSKLQTYKLGINDAGNPYGTVSIGYLLVGTRVDIPMMVQPGWSFQDERQSRRIESEAGVPLVGTSLSNIPILSATWNGLSESDLSNRTKPDSSADVSGFLFELDKMAKDINPALIGWPERELPARVLSNPTRDLESVAVFGRLTEDYVLTRQTGFAELAIEVRGDSQGPLTKVSPE